MENGPIKSQVVSVSMHLNDWLRNDCMSYYHIAVDCGQLSNPVNGQVQISPDTRLGAIAIYICNFGYQVNGAQRRYCRSDSKWSQNTPSCKSIMTNH